MYKYILLTHILAATVWTGGHLMLALRIIPAVLRTRSAAMLLDFERRYETIGLPALAVQIVTGPWLASRLVPINLWLSVANPYSRMVVLKLFCLALTAAFALDARFRVLPRIRDENVHTMLPHVIGVSILSVLFVVAGVGFRTGGWS